MSKRDELISRLTAIQKEFEGFPEEQTIKDTIDELSTNGARVPIPSPETSVQVTDILLMARTLSAYCRGRHCSECVFETGLVCPASSWLEDIDAELLAKHEGEEVTFYREDE